MLKNNKKMGVVADTPEELQIQVREARLVGVQDDDGYHLCIGFQKEITPEGKVIFEDNGQKVITYGTYEAAIQDLEICLSHAKKIREMRIEESQKVTKEIDDSVA